MQQENERELVQKLKKAEIQIENGELTNAETVFAQMREKYKY